MPNSPVAAPPHLPAIAGFEPGATKIKLSARVECARILRDLHPLVIAADPRATTTYAEIERAALLPPYDNVSADGVDTALRRDTDAILGCGSIEVIRAFSALLPRGADKVIPSRLSVADALPAFTIEMLGAASAWDNESLLRALLPLTAGLPEWADFWRMTFANPKASFMVNGEWTAGWAIAPLRVGEQMAVRSSTLSHGLKSGFHASYVRRVQPLTIGEDNWLEHAALYRLIDQERSELMFKPIARKSVMGPDAKVADATMAYASRALYAQDDGRAPWGMDPVAFLETPSEVRMRALRGLGRIAPTTSKAEAVKPPKMKKRRRDLGSFIDDTAASMTAPIFEMIAERYGQAVDFTLETSSPAQQQVGLDEAKVMLELLHRQALPIQKNDYVHTISMLHAAMSTGSMAFITQGEKIAREITATAPHTNNWRIGEHGFGSSHFERNLPAIARRCNAAFAKWVVQRLNLVERWTFLVLVQHKPQVFEAAAHGIHHGREGLAQVNTCLRAGQPEFGMGEVLVCGTGHAAYQTSLGSTHRLWDIADPGQRQAVFQMMLEGGGFTGKPGVVTYDYMLQGLDEDGFLFAAVVLAKTTGVSFARAAEMIPEGFLAKKLAATGAGQSFVDGFASVEDYVATPLEVILERARQTAPTLD